MSIIKQLIPQCDICGITNPDMLAETRNEVEQAIRANDWIKRGGKDICPECVKKGN